MKLSKKFILLMGPVGSGKDTQAQILADKIGYKMFKTTQALENKFRNAKPGDSDYEDMFKEKKMWEDGLLLTPTWVATVVSEEVENMMKSGAKGIIFSGSPRTLPEAEIDVPKFESLVGKESIVVFKLHISGEESIKRNSQRLFCENSHPINPEIAKTNPGVCPDDGGKVYKRELDNPDVIKVRLTEYENRTVPSIEFIVKRGIDVVEIPGENSIGEVADDIWHNLEKYIEK